MNVTVEQIRARLQAFDEQKAVYEHRSNHGGIQRHEVWRHIYLQDPYLIGAPQARVAERLKDVFINQTDLNHEAKIGMLPIEAGDEFISKFTHLLEEFGARGGMPVTMVRDAVRPIRRYFEHGDPIAVRMFQGYVAPPKPFLVRYGRREFLEPMLREGRIRVSPASFYSAGNLNDAIRDDELHRHFFLPTYRERLQGSQEIEVQGHRLRFGDDDINIPIVMDDYFLLSLCNDIYYRMPTDFDSDAALVVRDPRLFVRKTVGSFLASHPNWKVLYGPVTYYDPYRDYKKVKVPEMTKHFGYAYQREARIAFYDAVPSVGLEPTFLNIGSMEDYADLLIAQE